MGAITWAWKVTTTFTTLLLLLIPGLSTYTVNRQVLISWLVRDHYFKITICTTLYIIILFKQAKISNDFNFYMLLC
jgi:hypothetical protein